MLAFVLSAYRTYRKPPRSSLPRFISKLQSAKGTCVSMTCIGTCPSFPAAAAEVAQFYPDYCAIRVPCICTLLLCIIVFLNVLLNARLNSKFFSSSESFIPS